MDNKKQNKDIEQYKDIHTKVINYFKNKMDNACNERKECTSEYVKKMIYDLEVHKIELEMQNEELIRAQAELFNLKNRYFDLYDMAPVGYLTISEKEQILDANFTATTLLGMERGELIGRKISDFIAKEDQDIYYIYRKKLFNISEPASCDLQMVNSNNKKLWIQMSATCNNNFNDKPIIRLTLNNISEHKRMENELKSKDEMIIVQSRQAAVGEMMSMIAHQWRQPLNIIGLAITNVETKQMLDMLDDTALEDNIKIMTKNISYMSETIDTFRNFFKPDTVKELKTMNDVLRSISSIVGSSLENNNIKLNIINNSQTALLIHKSSLVQVLLNLINNAKDAFLDVHVNKAAIDVTIEETLETVIIKICDNAGGIPEDIIYDITKPYFTTKDLNGTGLGLYICQTIIEKHFAGTFDWYNITNGACFVITLNKE